VKLDVCVVVGVPEIAPVLDSDRPVGRLPELTDHV
jgi:septum formation inhibitor-activating ATPase MinD